MLHQSHPGFPFWTADRGTAWPSVMSPHILSDGQSRYAHSNTHICIHTVPCPEIPLRCQSSLCPFTVPLFRKLKKEHLVHWPPSASVSELGGTGIASSLVWSQYENVQAWMPHVAQGIQIDLGSDFSPMLMFYTVS